MSKNKEIVNNLHLIGGVLSLREIVMNLKMNIKIKTYYIIII